MRCNRCGSEMNEGDVFCGICGNKLPSVTIEEKGSAESRPKKICPSCKIEWDNNVEFCGKCGTATVVKADTAAENVIPEKKPAVKLCSQCGNAVDENAEFCGNCGAGLSPKGKEAFAHSVKSTMRETAVNTDPLKAENDKQGKSFFSKAGEL